MINATASHRLNQQVDFGVGDLVEVHAFGRWYEGIITKIGRSKVYVTYTSGTGVVREKAVAEDKVRESGLGR